MAAAVLANRADEIQSPRILVTSSGTSSWHVGEGAHQLSEKSWKSAGYSYSHSARQFTRDTFDQVDLILAMDLSNYANILELARHEEDQSKVAMFRSFTESSETNSSAVEVPDPWGSEIEVYLDVLAMVEEAVSGLLAYFKR